MTRSRFASLQGSLAQGALAALVVSLFASPASALTLAAEAATDLTATPFATNLGNPTDVVELPDGRVVVIEKGGNVKTFTPGMDDPVTSQIAVQTSGQNEQGVLGIVADPDFAKNNFIYIYASVVQETANRHQVRRYVLGADGKLGTMKPVIDMGLAGPANHNGGGLSIYGGYLFVGVGDTGKNPAPGTGGIPRNHIGSCLNKANGKVLRVSLAEATLGQPPADNPLMSVDMVSGCDDSSSTDNAPYVLRPAEKRIYAWGFRNPFRLWADPSTGKLWVGDVGESSKEEISLVEKGKHYGYPFEEGTEKYTTQQQEFQPANSCMGLTPAVPCVPPVTDYDTGQGAVMGGRILDGCGWPDKWRSRYIFGDHEQGKIWSIDVNATRDGMVAGSRKDFASTNGVTAMHMGTDNALYVVERGAGTVTRITAKAAPEAKPGSCLTTNPAPGGAGGAAAGGSAGAGNAGAASGGAAPAGGTNGNGAGATSASGSSNINGGVGNGSGGSSTTGAGTAATAGGGSTPGGDDGGCGCRVAAPRGNGALAVSGLLAALGLVLGRRRARRA